MSQEVLSAIFSIINIGNQRAVYTKIFRVLKKIIIDGLKNEEMFLKLFRYEKMSGSYLDNLKITKANEFDILLLLDFFVSKFKSHLNDKVEVKVDETHRGNVKIDLTSVLSFLNTVDKIEYYNILKKLVNEENYLSEQKLHSYFQKWMQNTVQRIGNIIIVDDIEYEIQYKRRGPAHMITVNNAKTELYLSVDFVPAFQFPLKKCVLQVIPEIGTHWEAIPKPCKHSRCDKISFRASYHEQEKVLLKDKDHMKAIIRLMKKFRDNVNLTNLKSYHIKTLFLLHDEGKDSSYWQGQVWQIMLDMFNKLLDALNRSEIPHYWHRDLNMLEDKDNSQIRAMRGQVNKAIKTLKVGGKTAILKLILTDRERNAASSANMTIVSDSITEFKEGNSWKNAVYAIALILLDIIFYYLFDKYNTFSEPDF